MREAKQSHDETLAKGKNGSLTLEYIISKMFGKHAYPLTHSRDWVKHQTWVSGAMTDLGILICNSTNGWSATQPRKETVQERMQWGREGRGNGIKVRGRTKWRTTASDPSYPWATHCQYCTCIYLLNFIRSLWFAFTDCYIWCSCLYAYLLSVCDRDYWKLHHHDFITYFRPPITWMANMHAPRCSLANTIFVAPRCHAPIDMDVLCKWCSICWLALGGGRFWWMLIQSAWNPTDPEAGWANGAPHEDELSLLASWSTDSDIYSSKEKLGQVSPMHHSKSLV